MKRRKNTLRRKMSANHRSFLLKSEIVTTREFVGEQYLKKLVVTQPKKNYFTIKKPEK